MMHGQSKQKGETLSQEELKLRTEKGQKILESLDYFFKVRKHETQQPEDQLAFSEIMAKLCPEIASIYNYRREILLGKFDTLKAGLAEQKSLDLYKQLMKLIQTEFMLITTLLKQHPKSYTLWTYRQWMVLRSQEIDEVIKTLPEELQLKQIEATKLEYELCSKMLDRDERNFHVWNYRNWLSSINAHSQEDQFTKKKIEQNFSNFSAYHFRSKFFMKNYNQPEQIIQRIKTEGVLGLLPLPIDRLNSETELIQQAIYIQPKEHGVYLYQRWLVGVVQPFGVISVKQTTQTQIVIEFNKKISNIEGSVQLLIDDKEIVISSSIHNQSIVLTFEELKNIHYKIKISNMLFENQKELSIESEDDFSKFVIPCEITCSHENEKTEYVISIPEEFKLGIQKVENYLEENISFIKQIIEEEQNNRYLSYQTRFPLMQILYLLQFKWNTCLIGESVIKYQQANIIAEEALGYCEKLINLQNDHQAQFLREFWMKRKSYI